MTHTPHSIQKVYIWLMLLNTLASSFIWGVNTIFLLDAGLTNVQAFAANAFFTIGQVVFEVPTGIVADTWGRRTSYLLGTLTLAASTLLYLLAWQAHAPFWAWAVTSMLLGLGFTFFSGATEAWLVDALNGTGFKGNLESVFAKGQVTAGIAMLVGSVSGGYVAQLSNLGMPYIIRAAILILTFVVAFIFMKDIGFTPTRGGKPLNDIRTLFKTSFRLGLANPPVRWVMLAAPFGAGVGFYAFYALQPYLLTLYGDKTAYGIAGLAAAAVAGAQIAGGVLVPYTRKLFTRRTNALLWGTIFSTGLLAAIGTSSHFFLAVTLMVLWALVGAAIAPIRQAYLNSLIPSAQRATVLSFDSLVSSTGGVVIQPVLGKVADTWNYPTSYIVGAAFQLISIPILFLAKKENTPADVIEK